MSMTSEPFPSLALRLKQETRELHALAERSGVMAELLRGRISGPAYHALLHELHALYAALEAALDAHRRDANVRRLWRPELRRLPSLAQDLSDLRQLASPELATPTQAAVRAQPGYSAPAQPVGFMPATRAYLARLQGLADAAPAMLLAHAYVRYLGDLHGGQVLARLLRERFGLSGDVGTAFFVFGSPEQVDRLRRDFRAGLDALELAPEQSQAFVAEAGDAFLMHQRLFEELHAAYPSGGAAA